ncbi:uncharacterized protein LOC106638689 isoform X2 [Copidosoma floridanum]|nr:uncharacterized protein LOC106638689 isoform X2 [Copidosoma floridanum]
MCKSVEVLRILDVKETLFNSNCRQNSAIASVSIMAKLRPPEKLDLKLLTLQLENSIDLASIIKKSVSLDSLSTCLYSSSPEDSGVCPLVKEKLINEIESLIDTVHNIDIKDNGDIDSSDDESLEKLSDDEDDDDDEGLIERGPVRPQLYPMYSNRSRPYVDCVLPNESSTDYDISAKEILMDQGNRRKIHSCLDQLSKMSPIVNSSSPADSTFGSSSTYSPPQQQQQQPQWQQSNGSPTGGSSSCFVPSITVSESESSLLEILSRGGFQSAQTPEHTSTGSVACIPLDTCPDSPAGSYNACAASRPGSQASSPAQSPGSMNGSVYGGPSFLNVVGSPIGSPQVSPLANNGFRCYPRPSSSSSSGQSYCETPSPANYHSPLDHHLEEQLGEHMMTQMPAWHEVFESSETLVNTTVGLISSELQLQIVDEVIRGDLRTPNQIPAVTSGYHHHQQQVVSPAASCLDGVDDGDELSLVRFTGGCGELALGSRDRPEPSQNSTSGYSSSSSTGSEARRVCDAGCGQPDLRAGLEFSSRMQAQVFPQSSSVLGNNHIEFQLPKSVPIYSSQRSDGSSKGSGRLNCTPRTGKTGEEGGSPGERVLAPWPFLNLPSTQASERLKEATDSREVARAMKSLLKRSLDQLAKGDEDGDTILMCLVGNPTELKKKLAYLAPLVERLGTIDGALSMLNCRGEDALYLAAMNCPEMAFVTGYLAAAFLQNNIDIGQRLYRSRGDTLIHALAAKGDNHGGVLAELLSLKTPQQNAVFDLSKRNYDGRTSLHVAAEAHESRGRNSKTISIATVRLLLESGADSTLREDRSGDTALHIAVSLSCDPSLVKSLLTGGGHAAVNIANYNGNTPLHLAASISDRTSLERQSEICGHLVSAGARSNITNRQGKTPLALVSADRKEHLRRVFYKIT